MPRAKKAPAETVETKAVEAEVKVEKREYQPFDLIPCQSLTTGTLYYLSPKSNTMYTWDANGDIVDMTYEDLLVMKQTHSEIMYRPCIMIMDTELLNQPRWADIKKLYASYDIISLADAEKILKLDTNSLGKALNKLLPGMRVVICNAAADMIEKGTLDSISKIKVIDEICGTELYTLAFK